jgi:hypothetical protein
MAIYHSSKEASRVITGMVRRLTLIGGISGAQEASYGDSHDRH